MAMTPQERSKPLHNFSLPCLKWGNQRVLKCVKVTDDHQQQQHHNGSSSSIPNGFRSKPINLEPSRNDKPNPPQGTSTSPPDPPRFNNGGVTKRLKASPLIEVERGNGNGNGNDDSSARPWNLRTRRAACKAPLKIEERNNIDWTKRNLEIIDSPRRNESSLIKKQSVDSMKEKTKLSVSLAKEEIEEDFMEMARIRPPRRPKKRPRLVQKYLDSIFPGLWLTEVSLDMYKVPELPES